nr:hypothetical protein [Hyphomonas sp. Mor2]
MNDLVPVSGRDLIFEPTESLSARILSAVEEKNEANDKIKDLEEQLQRERRKKHGANGRAFGLLVLALAAIAAAAFFWNNANMAETDKATVEAQLADANDTIAVQLVEIQGFDDYRALADRTIEVRRLDQILEEMRRDYPNTPGLDRETTILLEAQHANWRAAATDNLELDYENLTEAVDAVQEWMRARTIEPPRYCNLPQNPFRRRDQPNCG